MTLRLLTYVASLAALWAFSLIARAGLLGPSRGGDDQVADRVGEKRLGELQERGR